LKLYFTLQSLKFFGEKEVQVLYFTILEQFDIGKTFSCGIGPAHVNSTDLAGLTGPRPTVTAPMLASALRRSVTARRGHGERARARPRPSAGHR
jgi:hypothetical protein